MSINIIQQKALRNLLEIVSHRKINIPSQTTIMKTLSSLFDETKRTFIEIIRQQIHVCVTCDVWSSRAQAYIGMTLHFLTKEFKRVSLVLAFRQLNAKQTYKEMTEILVRVFNEFEIPISKIRHVVTDSGSAFCKAFKQYGKPADSFVEEIQQSDGPCDDDDEPSEMPFIQFESGE